MVMVAFLLLSLTVYLHFLPLPAASRKIYGVNLGSWLLVEPWMLPAEWIAMGGESCSDCSKCIGSEFELARAYPDSVDARFQKHWDSWFNEGDVQDLIDAGINTVRIPLGYWIIEALVDRRTEFYPRGGLRQLKRGLRQLKRADIQVILDHHALPGVQSPNSMFAGRCTSDAQFYTRYNYDRALVWTSIMTALAHLDPDFSNVVAIEAVNEPIMDANQTPGYGQFQKDFVRIVRGVEFLLGIGLPRPSRIRRQQNNFTAIMHDSAFANDDSDGVRQALLKSSSILDELTTEMDIGQLDDVSYLRFQSREPFMTSFMDVNWQFNNPPNPKDAEWGPALYDNHLYYNFGGVADPNEEAYMKSICNLRRVENDEALGNSPLVFGEWGLPTQFPASDEFLKKWADAQKLAYSKGAGWIFWNFKIEISAQAGDLARQWSYIEGVRRGYLTKDPSTLHDPHVCDPYII